MERAITPAKKSGPVFTSITYLDKNIERIKAGRLTRMDAIRALVEKGVNSATAAGTVLKWSRAAGIEWAKPVEKKPITKRVAKKGKAS